MTATRGEPWRLDGRATLVLDGGGADVLVVVANTADGPGLFEVRSEDAEVVTTPAVDVTLRFAEASFNGTPARVLATDAPELLPACAPWAPSPQPLCRRGRRRAPWISRWRT